MTNLTSVVAGLLCCLLTANAARAQTTIDVAKITCEQFRLYKITNPNNIALWISGYYNGVRGNTVLDTQKLDDHMEKLKDYCITNYKVTVMQAVETLFGVNK